MCSINPVHNCIHNCYFFSQLIFKSFLVHHWIKKHNDNEKSQNCTKTFIMVRPSWIFSHSNQCYPNWGMEGEKGFYFKIYNRIWGIAWWGINIYLVCGNTMCVSTCQVEFVLRELSCVILLPHTCSRFIRCSGDFSVLKRTVLLFNYYQGGRYRKIG